MVALLRFIASNAWLIACVCLLIAARFVWRAWAIHRAGHSTPYSLEREGLTDRVGRAWVMAVVLMLMSAAVLLSSPVILDYTVDVMELGSPTPAAGILTQTPTPFSPVTPISLLPTPTVLAPVSATLPLEVATVEPEDTTPTPMPPQVSAACPDPGVQLSAPAGGQLLSGPFEIRGTADIPGFSFYKFEISGPITAGEWRTVGDLLYTPVGNGVLGYWDAASVAAEAPGLYLFRLMVVDNTGNYPPPCTVQVQIGTE